MNNNLELVRVIFILFVLNIAASSIYFLILAGKLEAIERKLDEK